MKMPTQEVLLIAVVASSHSRYTDAPGPEAVQDVNVTYFTSNVELSLSVLTYTAPPLPDVDEQEVNTVGCSSSVPAMLRV